jgi:hypothetical protein
MRILNILGAGVLAATIAGCVVAPESYTEPEATTYEGSDQISEPPPPLPDYEQPPCPVEGYVWTPGIWQWGPAGYFWVPGTWVEPPAVGLLWTPGYWGFAAGVYAFHRGYWGPRVGFYGGVNYGHGYFGSGYAGGRWVNNNFHYNTAVTNVNVTNIHNTYNQTIVNNINVTNVTNITRVSYSGGTGGARSAPNSAELEAAREAHVPPTGPQVQHEMSARSNPQFAASRNEGHPSIAATSHPGAFGGAGVVAAKSTGPVYRPQTPPAARGSLANPFVHARDVTMPSRSEAPGNTAPEQTYARQQYEMQARQEQERQALARQQEQEHAQLASQTVHNHQAYSSMERQHQQQTTQMVQRHQQEREQFSRNGPKNR